MIYKQVLVPDKNNHTIVIELGESSKDAKPAPPAGKMVSLNELFEDFGTATDFPSADEIRAKAWPSKW